MSLRSWGQLMIGNAYRCNSRLISDPRNRELFTATLVKRINMVAYGKPLIQYFGFQDKAGYSLVQLIETSCITAHFSDDSGDAYFDIFSCRPIDEVAARAVIDQYFQPQSLDTQVIDRQARPKLE